LPPHARRFLKTYSTWHEGLKLWVLCGDNGRHFNHSDKPTTVSLGIGFGDDVAAEDLEAGTELTTDYNTICDAVLLNGTAFCSRSVVEGVDHRPASRQEGVGSDSERLQVDV